ncbi:MAG: methyltransferase domain-containing protein, partial [Acidimicrobiia bacterium]
MPGTPSTPTGSALPGGYARTRAWLHEYFDRHAAKSWETLTSGAPVSGIRATVRAGRDRMRALMLSWLPTNLSGVRVLDAGCGTGYGLANLRARYPEAELCALDIAPGMLAVTRARLPQSTWTQRALQRLTPHASRLNHLVCADLARLPLAAN